MPSPLPTVAHVIAFLESLAPLPLAESWDNVGLLLGRREQPVGRVMTCLTVTSDSGQEALDERADLIVTHHPMLFRAVKKITDETSEGRLTLDLLSQRVCVYSAHTAYDSAAQGINRRLAEALGLRDVAPLVPASSTSAAMLANGGDAADDDGENKAPPLGAGRFGSLPRPVPLRQLAETLKSFLGIATLQAVGDPERPVQRVAVACGSAGELLTPAIRLGCECFVTGELRFHSGLEAEAADVTLLLTGHYASERFGMEALAELLAQRFPGLSAWASRREHDPFRWL